MAGGQAFDLAAVGKRLSAAELERMHVFKTGALIRASVRLGALAAGCADAVVLDALERYGHCLGLAFQIRDDILDVEGDSATIGKTAGKDAADDKPTYPAILGMDGARAELDALTRSALAAIAGLGASFAPLAELARFVAQRKS
jgi:geranylgeranyl pyrophosphate synthase